MFKRLALFSVVGGAVAVFGQTAPAAQDVPAPESTATPAAQPTAQPQGGLKRRDEPQPAGPYQIAAGTHVVLSMINSVSTKQAQPGDRIYPETAFPVVSGTRIVIPPGSWVTGTIPAVK